MAFYGCDFTFGDKKASDFGLMLYNIGSYSQDDADFSVGEIVEDRISRRYDSLLYGLVQNEPLQFTLVFGMDPDDLERPLPWVRGKPGGYMKGDRVRRGGKTWECLIDGNSDDPIDGTVFVSKWLETENCIKRSDIAEITNWLTGHQTYQNLKIDQADMKSPPPYMRDYVYHAMVTGLKLITNDGLPVAFSAEITCDSPYAYIVHRQTEVNIMDGDILTINNESKINGCYYPKFTLRIDQNATYITFTNTNDGNRVMSITDIPHESNHIITIDCQNQIIESGYGYNLYPGFNKKFLRLVPGENNITIGTDDEATIDLIRVDNEFPVNIGA